jgi:hypothetical protein
MVKALWVMGLVSVMIAATGAKPQAERRPTARVLALAKTCAVRQRVSAAAFEEHLTKEDRGRAGWSIVLHGADPKQRLAYARRIAEASGATLHVVDAAALVGKYIGETEKNLGALLELAQQQNAVLFFDEADALFGKRSEVKDAHDRYANRAASTIPKVVLGGDDLVVFGTIDPPADREASVPLRDVVLPADPPADAESAPTLPWSRLCWSPKR